MRVVFFGLGLLVIALAVGLIVKVTGNDRPAVAASADADDDAAPAPPRPPIAVAAARPVAPASASAGAGTQAAAQRLVPVPNEPLDQAAELAKKEKILIDRELPRRMAAQAAVCYVEGPARNHRVTLTYSLVVRGGQGSLRDLTVKSTELAPATTDCIVEALRDLTLEVGLADRETAGETSLSLQELRRAQRRNKPNEDGDRAPGQPAPSLPSL